MAINFVDKGRYEMLDFVEKGINDLIEVLDSPINYPRDKEGNVQEHRLLAVVKSREQVYVEAMDMIDMINIGSHRFLKKIIRGLQTTWHELTKIVVWDISRIPEVEKDELDAMSALLAGNADIQDNYLGSIANAKKLAAKIAFNILDRIEKLEMTDEEKTKLMQQKVVANTAERYAEN